MAPHHPVTPQSNLPTLSDASALADYLRYAALNNPGVGAAFLRWKAALEKVAQARSLPDPRFNYRYFIEQVETRVGPQRQGFGLAQTFPWLSKLRLRGDAAAEAADAAMQQYEAAKLDLFLEVKDAYYEYYYLGRAIAIARENRKLMEYFEEVARTRYKVAEAKHPDVIRAQVELGKLDDRLRALEDLQGPVAARLNASLNRPLHEPLPWPNSLPTEGITATDEQVLTWFRQVNPELKALGHEIAKERHLLALARKDYFPDVTLGLDYIDTEHANMSGVPDSGKDPIIGMVSVNLPIWYSKYRASEREAAARHRMAAKTKANRENVLGAQIKMVLYNLRDAARKMDLYRDTLVPKARQSLKATEAAFRAGNANFLDLLDTQRVLLEFELSYERASANHAQRLAELERWVGMEMPRSGSAAERGEDEKNFEKQEGVEP